jgi:hypothetical protein
MATVLTSKVFPKICLYRSFVGFFEYSLICLIFLFIYISALSSCQCEFTV